MESELVEKDEEMKKTQKAYRKICPIRFDDIDDACTYTIFPDNAFMEAFCIVYIEPHWKDFRSWKNCIKHDVQAKACGSSVDTSKEDEEPVEHDDRE